MTRANPTAIGAFVLGAVVLTITGILVFGSGDLFAQRYRYVMYFEGSVTGLTVGAPVAFEGVQVGSIREIRATVDPDTLKIRIPVIAEFVSGRVQTLGKASGTPIENMARLVAKGMRAQLQMQSFVTGQLHVALAMHKDAGSIPLTVDPATELHEIPTIPTALQEFEKTFRSLVQKLEDVPFDVIFEDIQSTFASIDGILSSPELKNVLVNLNRALKAAEEGLSMVADDSPVRYETLQALRAVTEAAESLRNLADVLERNPEALIRGRRQGGN